MSQFKSSYKENNQFYTEYESKDKLTAKELLDLLIEADKEIDLDKVIVTRGMPYVGREECESVSISHQTLDF